MVNGANLEPMWKDSFDGLMDKYGSTINHYHRVDLHRTLREMAQESSGAAKGKPATIRLATKVREVDVGDGVIGFDDGTSVRKDLVVIADGIKSRFVSYITGQDEPLVRNGRSVYRCLVPFNEINKEARLREIFQRQAPGFWVPFTPTSATYVVTYPCHSNSVLNVALIHPSLPHQISSPDSWHEPATIENALEAVKAHHTTIHELIAKTPDVRAHTLFRREPLSRLTRGKAVLVGDAAHILQPTHAQGGTMAVEEGVVLEILFSGLSDRRQVLRRLEAYNELLSKRVQLTQYLSDSLPGRGDIARRKAESLALETGDDLPADDSMQFSEPWRDFFYRRDVMQDAEDAVKGMI
ncbi:hypothetical protein LTR70_009185 [Exophiala xenobiotica]|uniref:FAD-binding domain-containing protein n=1 Tax=Lithohypha guttulata TaxID=1690604 RepID=A0ABR0JYF8_9EURO|nr:hypothetical protein LTR24_008964 [Lithohypha guttulata]KAK5310858.1 hypothetical protein LTR70_009185 [Exophiala xenobiotica]